MRQTFLCSFDEYLDIYCMFSDDKEEVPMQEIISTSAARGCVERWLLQVISLNFMYLLSSSQSFTEQISMYLQNVEKYRVESKLNV